MIKTIYGQVIGNLTLTWESQGRQLAAHVTYDNHEVTQASHYFGIKMTFYGLYNNTTPLFEVSGSIFFVR